MEDFSYESAVSKVRVPESILHFTPSQEVLFHSQGKNLQRNIFKHQTFNARELEKIKRLKEMIQKEKLALPGDWDDSDLLKFVYGSGFKTRNSFKSIKSCLESHSEVFPEPLHVLYPKILEILVKLIQKTGPLYFHGRDENYRPLLVMNFAKFDLKKYSFDQYLQSACFVLEFAGKHMLCPGKVENWMCISDLGFKGLGDLPLNTLRKITKVLQDVFKCRLAYSAMINVPKSVYFIYSCLKPFLDDVTIDKISIAKDNVANNIIKHFNPYQIEERYGGKAKNLEVFWPPCFPDCPVNLDGGPEQLKPESVKSSSPEINEKYQESFDVSCLSQPAAEVVKEDEQNEHEVQVKEQKESKKREKKRKNKKERKIKKKPRKNEENEETSRKGLNHQPSLKKKQKERKTEEPVRSSEDINLTLEIKGDKLDKSNDDAEAIEGYIEIERSSIETFCGLDRKCIVQ